MLMTKRCQKCNTLIGEGGARYHEDLSCNNMTACQEDLLYDSFP